MCVCKQGVAGARALALHVHMNSYLHKVIDKTQDFMKSFLKLFIKSEGHTSRGITDMSYERVGMTGQSVQTPSLLSTLLA